MKTPIQTLKGFYQNHAVWCNLLLLFIWMSVNLIQATFTGLTNDEAYYWMYSQHLDYGYFDHPPAIAVIIKAGFSIFQNEIGVRWIVVLMGTGFVWITFLLTNRQNFPLFFLLVCTVSCMEVYGFIAVPDAPLLFFTAAFFLLYKRWLNDNRFVNTLLLGITIALLLYCKYHGLLVLFFTLLSNLRLLKNKQFYLLILISVTAYLPHIVWQINNDYPSYQYHVLTKSQDPYNPLDSLVYIGGQLLIFGPIMSVFLFGSVLRYQAQNLLEKALLFTGVGFILFFLLSTLNAPVEANWTLVAVVPLLVLGYQSISTQNKLKKWAIPLSLISCVLFLFFRINLIFDFVPTLGSKLIPEFYGWRTWAMQIQEKAKDSPVVFTNSYQKASKYSFYTGNYSLSLNNVQYRRNQFDLWSIEDSLQGKQVLYIPNWEMEGAQKLKTNKEEVNYLFIDNFRSYAKIAIQTEQPRYTFQAGTKVNLPLTLKNNYSKPVTFGENKDYADWLVFCLFHEEETVGEEKKLLLNGLTIVDTFTTKATFHVPKKKGVYYLRISIKNGWLPPGINSRLIRLVVE